jgi:hypothetical protein
MYGNPKEIIPSNLNANADKKISKSLATASSTAFPLQYECHKQETILNIPTLYLFKTKYTGVRL